jgi:nitrogen fixation-related uncharacterized protein
MDIIQVSCLIGIAILLGTIIGIALFGRDGILDRWMDR